MKVTRLTYDPDGDILLERENEREAEEAPVV